MQTNSLIINAIVKFLKMLNIWFEHSLTCKFCLYIKSQCKNSRFLSMIEERNIDYYAGSFVLKFAVVICYFLCAIAKLIFGFFKKHNKSSLNRKIFVMDFTPVFNMFKGSFPYKFILWFYDND